MPACPVGPADRTGVVNFLACLDIEQNTSFLDRHEFIEAIVIIRPFKHNGLNAIDLYLSLTLPKALLQVVRLALL